MSFRELIETAQLDNNNINIIKIHFIIILQCLIIPPSINNFRYFTYTFRQTKIDCLAWSNMLSDFLALRVQCKSWYLILQFKILALRKSNKLQYHLLIYILPILQILVCIHRLSSNLYTPIYCGSIEEVFIPWNGKKTFVLYRLQGL